MIDHDADRPVSSFMGDLTTLIQDVQPVLHDVVEVARDVKDGRLVDAISQAPEIIDGVGKVAADLPALAEDFVPMKNAVKATAGDIAHVLSRLISGGLVGVVEHELGAIEQGAKDKIHAFVRGLLHAIGSDTPSSPTST